MVEEEKQPSMADIMGTMTASSNGSEEEILRIASDYSLQLNPTQLRTLMMLDMLAFEQRKKNAELSLQIIKFSDNYLKIKHYHESGMFIMRVIDALSVKKLVPNDAVKVNVMK